MTLRRQLLLLLLVHLALALAAWDGYRLGLRRGRATNSAVRVISPEQFYAAPAPAAEPPALPPERTDANWRGN